MVSGDRNPPIPGWHPVAARPFGGSLTPRGGGSPGWGFTDVFLSKASQFICQQSMANMTKKVPKVGPQWVGLKRLK